MANSSEPCWCNDVVIPEQLLELIPLAMKDKSCICLSCINLYKKDSSLFKSELLRKGILS
jgi:hypothetical protein